jgi:hypothetical protein
LLTIVRVVGPVAEEEIGLYQLVNDQDVVGVHAAGLSAVWIDRSSRAHRSRRRSLPLQALSSRAVELALAAPP